jgi:hypothetical protein
MRWHGACSCSSRGYSRPSYHFWEYIMSWTKPQAEVVAVTMEVTAYVATL